MKKFFKIILRILLVLIIFIIVFTLIMIIPVKKTVKIDTVKGDFQVLTVKDTKIFCYCEPTVTGPKWTIVGKGNTLFERPSQNIPENQYYIALEGNYPKKLDWSLSHNIFIFEGAYEPDKVDNAYKLKTFKVKKWDILYPMKCDDGKTLKQKNFITIDDIFWGDDMPNY